MENYKCQNCFKKLATHFCDDCGIALCEDCLDFKTILCKNCYKNIITSMNKKEIRKKLREVRTELWHHYHNLAEWETKDYIISRIDEILEKLF